MVNWRALTILGIFLLLGNYSFIDIKEAIIYYGDKILPNSPGGEILVIIIFLLILFMDEILGRITKIKEIRIKKTFK